MVFFFNLRMRKSIPTALWENMFLVFSLHFINTLERKKGAGLGNGNQELAANTTSDGRKHTSIGA